MNNRKSEHQQRVEEFMRKARQNLPAKPTIPPLDVLKLRAALILEEALETIGAMGLGVASVGATADLVAEPKAFVFMENKPANLEDIVDGLADLSVVSTGTLSACGVADLPVYEAVDENNLAKFGPGHSWRADGKLIKPPDHKPPDFSAVLAAQRE